MQETISGLMHLSLRVKDYQKSLDFYCRGLDFKKMFEYTRRDLYELDPSQATKKSRGDENDIWLAYLSIKQGQYLEIFPVPGEKVAKYNEKQSFFHFSLQVADVKKTVATLRKRGIKIYKFASDIPGKKAIRGRFVPLRGKCGSLIAWACDPDGNMIEIMELTEKSSQRIYDEDHAAK